MSFYAEIAVGSFVSESDNDMNVYDYIIPERYKDVLKTGMRVVVPFGGRVLEGYTIDIKSSTHVDIKKLREVLDIPDNEPIFDKRQISLARWMSGEYMCSLSDSLKCILPSEMVLREVKYVSLGSFNPENMDMLSSPEKTIIEELVKAKGEMPVGRLKSILGNSTHNVLRKMIDKGFLLPESRVTSGVSCKTVKGIEINPELYDIERIISEMEQKKSLKGQAELLKVLKDSKVQTNEKDFLGKYGFSKSTINTLIKKGIVNSVKLEMLRDPFKDTRFLSYEKPSLTGEQKTAVDSIMKGYYEDKKRAYLLHGVTGSGKTEVYMTLIEHFLENGKQAIMLVPEISLTPQTIERFKGRFERVAVLHSRLSAGERYDEWKRINSGEVDVVIGARSAVFAPVRNLGIIIIDEEHEYSYKSDKNPKYHAREVAYKRCEIEGSLLVLGSATPSIETFYQALNDKYVICTMSKRVDGKLMPMLEVADMRQEIAAGNNTIFSRRLYDEIKAVLKRGQQVILFLNRRGFSTFVSCRKCGHVMKCPRCDVSLTYHMDRNALNCHYCDMTVKSPEVCPKCGSRYIKYFGIGTQKVEAEVKKHFPGARILRMDMDTTSRKGSHERLYRAFKNNEADILVGTQMISKGLDFPNVTLVGIIAADLTLNIPDYKASERTFQLITQVAGRAGRGEFPGKVVIQTYTPGHYSIESSLSQDYVEFYNKEVLVRKAFYYPPFSDLVNIIVSSKNEEDASKIIRQLTERIKANLGRTLTEVNILGPSPAPLSKINMYFRWQTILKGKIGTDFKRYLMEEASSINKRYKSVSVNIDINPISLA